MFAWSFPVTKNAPNLDYIINAHNYQKIQDCLSEASDMAILTVDYQGVPVTRHSRCSTYCTLVRSNPELNNLCRKCDARGGLEAARISKPYIYRCHMGILDLAVPIVLEGMYTGAIMAGQVVLSDDGQSGLERIVETSTIPLDPEFKKQLDQEKKMLPVMSQDRVQVIANMLFQINNYIIEEAMLKIRLSESLGESTAASGDTAGAEGSRIAEVKSGNSTKEFVTSKSVTVRPVYNSVIVKPALEYIENHFDERLTLDDMASLCNISSSYFSKLFNRITGENFSNYVNTVRIRKACELLENGDLPITTIAFDLGYEDISYFDKVFKRLTGVTPSQYKSGCRSADFF